MLRLFIIICISLLWSLHTNGQVTFLVTDIPANTPEKDAIHIAGSFQDWNPNSNAHVLTKDSLTATYSLTLSNIEGAIEFKFARGDWSKVESNENGGFRPNRTHNVSDGDTLELQILGWEDLDVNGGGTSTAAANVTILTDSFYMPQLNRYRRIWLYLPPNYDETNFNYPVLYMHDGQNVFDANTSFAGEWKVDETLNDLHAKGDSGIIVVAIDNGGAERINELTPWVNARYGGGDGDKYLQFIVEDLKPYIDDNYRTKTDRQNTGIMGSSLGGLISTYAALEHGNVFGKIGSFSPAYWINPEIFAFEFEDAVLSKTKIYQIAGANESETMVPLMMAMQDSLLAIGFEKSNIKSIAKPDGAHSEWFWAREFEDAYLFLFRNTSSHMEQPNLPSFQFELYPNPTQNAINIRIAAQSSIKITAKIVDINGKMVAPLVNDKMEAGVQNFHFNKGFFHLVPGVYYIQVQTKGAFRTEKLVIVE